MKKILFVLIAAAFVISFCFIQLPSAKAADEAKTFIGKIESIAKRLGKPPKWEHAILTVVADSGEKTVVYVIKATAVTDISGKDMNEGGRKFGIFSLKKGERIEVKYSAVSKNRNEAISIRCLD